MIKSKFQRVRTLPAIINDVPVEILIPAEVESKFRLTISQRGDILVWPVAISNEHEIKQNRFQGTHFSDTQVPIVVAELTNKNVPNWENLIFHVNLEYVKNDPLIVYLEQSLRVCTLELPIPLTANGPEKIGFYYDTGKLQVCSLENPREGHPAHLHIRWGTLIQMGLLFNSKDAVISHHNSICGAHHEN